MPPPAADETEQARRARLLRAVDRGVRSTQFDSAAWFAQWQAPADAQKRSDEAVRLLFAVAPQTPPQATEPLALRARARARRGATSSNERCESRRPA